MKNFLFVSVLILFAGTLFAQTATPPSAGAGTSGNPYQIASLENLYWIASSTANWNKYYLQTSDINASITSSWFSGAGWTPIGNGATKFTGSYNGNGHTIDGLFINRPSTGYIGLFGITSGAVIDSIGITNANITGDTCVGGLVGVNWFYSTVSKCYSSGSVNGKQCVGGLVGRNEYSPVSNSYSTGSVIGNSTIGGLMGLNDYSAVNNCYSAGSVSGVSYSTGGLIGDNSSSTVSNSFWDTQTSGCGTSDGGTGITTVYMKNPITFSLVGWDDTGTIWKIDGSINNGYPFLSWQNTGGTPLQKTIIAPSASDGTSGNPYQIASLENLYWIAFQANSGTNFTGVYFEQTANINASVTSSWFGGAGWTPIGNGATKFTGSYNGNGHTIDGLFINRPSTSFIGLFGATNGGVIDSIGITNANITGNGEVGGLVGWNFYSTVSNCYSTGSVSGTGSSVGSLVGSNSGTVNNCYSTGSVSGAEYTSGLVGYNSATVNNCYSTGSVSGTGSYVGGLVGYNYFGTVNYSFWNIETSGKSTSNGGTGETTAEMKTKLTFSLAGWNSSIWYMDAGFNNGYPYLSWQNPGGTPLPKTATAPSVGNGTSGNAYQIASLNNLYWIALNTENWDKFYIQTANINASVTSSWFNGAGWTPIGNDITNFTGHYNGNGHTIDSLFINRPSTDFIGLFGYTRYRYGAVVFLGITNARITGRNYVGGLVGANDYSEVAYCYSSGSVSGYSYVGGLVGDNDDSSTVLNCYSSGSVNGTYSVGGLVGDNFSISTVSNSYSTGSVNGNNSYVGGLVGENYSYSIVSNCYSSGSVNGNSSVGGLVGENYVGGVTNCYSIGSVSSKGSYIGGLVGYNNGGSVDSSFWDTVTSMQSTSDAGTGKTTAEMKTRSTFINAGWDFTTVWQMTGTNYPDLRTNINPALPVERQVGIVPKEFALAQNYPNPFNPTTTISFAIPSKSFVSLKIFDILGREVATIVSEEMPAGSYSKQWNAANISSGIYFYILQTGAFTQTKKLILLK